MKKLQYIVLTTILLTSSSIFAQQESLFTFYRSNMNIVNPAYAGVDNEIVVKSAIRSQWTGIPDAPETKTVSFGTPLIKNIGFGATVVNDKTFIENQTFLGFDFSYKLKMNETADLYLGIKAGGNFYEVNTSGIETYNIISDPALGSLSHFNPNVGVGALLKNEKWYASLSIPRLLNTTRARNEAGYAMTDLDRPHVYLSGGFDHPIDETLTFKPSVMLRYVQGAPVSLDLNANLQIYSNLELGVMYRIDRAYAAMGTLKLGKHFAVGLATEISTSPTLVAAAKNTSEIFLQFKL